jgi:hypothetical protein
MQGILPGILCTILRLDRMSKSEQPWHLLITLEPFNSSEYSIKSRMVNESERALEEVIMTHIKLLQG